MATTMGPKESRVAILEDLSASGRLVYLAPPREVILELPKSLVPTAGEPRLPDGLSLAQVLPGSADVLRTHLLASTDDPSLDEVAALFPPIRRVRYGPWEGPHTFVGSPGSLDVVPLYYNPIGATPRVNPLALSSEFRHAIEVGAVEEGLVGGWTPIVRFVYRASANVAWEMLAFGDVRRSRPLRQPVWYRFLRIDGGRVSAVHYVDSFLPYPRPQKPPPGRFYAALAHTVDYWRDRLAGAMRVTVPDRWVSEFCYHGLVREMITRAGDHPRYGIVDRAYGSFDHDGFQDILNNSVTCMLEWGLFERARAYLDQYFDEFVRPDGSIEYRGPEIGQYGRMLATFAQYVEYTGDTDLLLTHLAKLDAIAEILLERRNASLALPDGHPARGLIAGRHEADISFDTPTLMEYDYEQPYFSNSAQAWRGFRDLGRVFRDVGLRDGRPDLVIRGQRLLSVASALASDLQRSVDASVQRLNDLNALPLFPGATILHLDAPYRSRPEAFDENRVWSELLHSGFLSKGDVQLILDFAAETGGSTLGIFNNRSRVITFLAAGTAYGLIHHDFIRELLILYWALVSHCHTRGTWTAFEGVDLDRERAEHLPYCAPAQLTVPLITKWMLAFEDPRTGELWLAKATPRHWLRSGEGISVAGAPTREGSVSYSVASEIDAGRVTAIIERQARPTSDTLLRLRVPGRYRMVRVRVNGRPWPAFDPGLETVRLPPSLGTHLDVTVEYNTADPAPVAV